MTIEQDNSPINCGEIILMSAEPIGDQPPLPAGVHDWEFSLDRKRRMMRIKDEQGNAWWFKSGAGRILLTSCDSERGRIYLRGKAVLQGDGLYVYPPRDEEPVLPPADAAVLPDSHYRLCYTRPKRAWRLRDERSNHLYSDEIKGYKGFLNLDWRDGGSHVFHDGQIAIGKDGIAYLMKGVA